MRSAEGKAAGDSIQTASDRDGDRPEKRPWYQTWGPPLVILGGTAVMGVVGWVAVSYMNLFNELIREQFEGVENRITATDERIIQEFNALNGKLDGFRETSERRIERLENLHLTANPDEAGDVAAVADQSQPMGDGLGGYRFKGVVPVAEGTRLDSSKALARSSSARH